MNHLLRSMGPNPYGWMCYCINCGKAFANYKSYKNCPGKKSDKKHYEKTNQTPKIQ